MNGNIDLNNVEMHSIMINENCVKNFCKEEISKIDNFDKALNDKTQTWHCHHRTEIWWDCSKKELIENGCYYNRNACELIFLTPEEHISLHRKGKVFSEEHRKKISESLKGVQHSEDARIKMSEAHKGKSQTKETKLKQSAALKGKKKKPFTEEHRKKLSEAKKSYWQSKKVVGI